MKIKNRNYDLKAGSILIGNDGEYMLTSDYDSFHQCYYANEIELQVDGSVITLADTCLTLYDIIDMTLI